MTIKIFPIVMAASLLAGCSSVDQTAADEDVSTEFDRELYLLPDSPRLKDIVKHLADQLELSSRYVNKAEPIAITSFVELNDLRQTNELGNQLSEMMLVELQQRGWTLIDFKITGDIDVTEQGDLALSRDFMRLQHRHAIEYLMTGTMVSTEEGVHLTARLVGLESRVVVASAQTMIPSTVFVHRKGHTSRGGYISQDHQTGMLIRKGS